MPQDFASEESLHSQSIKNELRIITELKQTQDADSLKHMSQIKVYGLKSRRVVSVSQGRQKK